MARTKYPCDSKRAISSPTISPNLSRNTGSFFSFELLKSMDMYRLQVINCRSQITHHRFVAIALQWIDHIARHAASSIAHSFLNKRRKPCKYGSRIVPRDNRWLFCFSSAWIFFLYALSGGRHLLSGGTRGHNVIWQRDLFSCVGNVIRKESDPFLTCAFQWSPAVEVNFQTPGRSLLANKDPK